MTRIPIDDDNQNDDLGEQNEVEPQEQAGAEAPASNELIELRAERNQLYERLARATAEFKNAQRRLESENQSQAQYANSSLIKSLLPTIDNFERALGQDASKVDSATILKGVQIVYDHLIAVLKSQRVEPIAPAVGDHFDATRHEALMQQPSDKYTEPTVTQVFQKGYTLQGRTLRPAQVAVSQMS